VGGETPLTAISVEAQDLQQVAGLARVVAAVEVQRRVQVLDVLVLVLGQWADHFHDA
jgi:hypothetical protein